MDTLGIIAILATLSPEQRAATQAVVGLFAHANLSPEEGCEVLKAILAMQGE